MLKHRYFLAPMAGVTDLAYRLFMSELGAEVLTSELISADSFVHGSKRTREMMEIHPDENYSGIQIFGTIPEHMCAIAQYSESIGADFIDLNFGCPVPKVIKSGAGSAMLKNLPGMERLISSLKKSINIPLSIKIRTGWDQHSINASDICKLAADYDVAWVALHGRTREQGYSGNADWEYIKSVSESSLVPIIGNGDLIYSNQGKKLIEEGYCHGVMYGRGALCNPYLFLESINPPGEKKSIHDLIKRYYDLVLTYNHPKVRHAKLKKFLNWIATGMENKASFRKSIFSLGQDPEEILQAGLNFITDEGFRLRQKPNLEFLKGGHG